MSTATPEQQTQQQAVKATIHNVFERLKEKGWELPEKGPDDEANLAIVLAHFKKTGAAFTEQTLEEAITTNRERLTWLRRPRERTAQEIAVNNLGLGSHRTELDQYEPEPDRLPTPEDVRTALKKLFEKGAKVSEEKFVPLALNATPEQIKAATPRQLKFYLQQMERQHRAELEGHRMNRKLK